MKTNSPAPVNNHMRTRACTACGWRGTYNLEQTGHTCLCCNQPVTVTPATMQDADGSPVTISHITPDQHADAVRYTSMVDVRTVEHPYVSEIE